MLDVYDVMLCNSERMLQIFIADGVYLYCDGTRVSSVKDIDWLPEANRRAAENQIKADAKAEEKTELEKLAKASEELSKVGKK